MRIGCHTLERIGVSVTGPVDPRTGKLFTPPNTGPVLAGLELGEALSRAACLEVRVDRDTNAAALGEHRCGSARGTANFVFITVSTGVGGAVMLAGRLIRGADGVAGSFSPARSASRSASVRQSMAVEAPTPRGSNPTTS